jgi:hypothetical protein
LRAGGEYHWLSDGSTRQRERLPEVAAPVGSKEVDDTADVPGHPGIDRRAMIKAAAAAGVAAWTAPVIIDSLASPAAAASASCITFTAGSASCDGGFLVNSSTWNYTVTNNSGAAVNVAVTLTFTNHCVTDPCVILTGSQAVFTQSGTFGTVGSSPVTVNLGASSTQGPTTHSVAANSSATIIVSVNPANFCTARMQVDAVATWTCPGGSPKSTTLTGTAITCGILGTC